MTQNANFKLPPALVRVRSALAQKLQDAGDDPSGFTARFTKILRAAKHLPR